MEALKHLHISVAKTIDKCFDTTTRDLNVTFAEYDARVKDAESKAKDAIEARQKAVSDADVLRHNSSLLQEELCRIENESKENEKAMEYRQHLEEEYAPQVVLGSIDTSELDTGGFDILGQKYTELYEYVRMLVKTSGRLRGQIKRHKRKLEQWSTKMEHLQSCLQRQDFSYMVGGEMVEFKRVETKRTNDQMIPLVSPHQEAETVSVQNHGETTYLIHCPSASASCANRDAESSSRPTGEGDIAYEMRLREQHLEVASIDELPPATPTVSSGRAEGFKRKRSCLGYPGQKNGMSSHSSNNGKLEHPILVKSETMSSSPLRIYSPHSMPRGTQDLDDIGDTVTTPTKRVRFHKKQGLQLPVEECAISTGPLSARKMANRDSSNKGNRLMYKKSGVLQPINGNKRIFNGLGTATIERRTKGQGTVMRISSLTEDGDEDRPPSWAKSKDSKFPQENISRRHTSSDHRLSNLLERQSTTSHTMQLKLSRDTETRAVKHSLQPHTRGSPSLSCNEMAPSSISTTVLPISKHPCCKLPLNPQRATVNQNQHISEWSTQMEPVPDDEPYRARPVQRLGLDHFKINPDFNDGLDYAYNDVIRKKDERKCVSGCTRPGCCGETFSAMVRFGMPFNTSEEEMSDREVLEEYLGRDLDLTNKLNSQSRESLLIEAKTTVLSNRFGRHRHQHQRPGSPPGFWRTEMPGTQEVEKDREEARRLEREKVKERYMEAMRPGGRWIFADE
ncbi:DNA repair protein endonuclease SAE2/CtIP C-terminus-domain-containing protein [Aspergillus crustosus]